MHRRLDADPPSEGDTAGTRRDCAPLIDAPNPRSLARWCCANRASPIGIDNPPHGVHRLVARRQGFTHLQSHGELAAVRIEGCGSWGAGLARYLSERQGTVIEVNRPNRQNRRLRGKSDTVDAEAAARAVLDGQATVTPKAATGAVEALRQLRIARSGAVQARTAADNQLHSLCDTAPDSSGPSSLGCR